MQRHILNKRKHSCAHISPRVNLQVLKKDLSKEKPWESCVKNSSETTFEENNSNFKKKTLDGQRLPTNFDRKPTIRIKVTERKSQLLKQNNKEEKEILSFVTQYQPSVSTIKEAWMKKWNLIQTNYNFNKFLKNHRSFPYKKEGKRFTEGSTPV